MLADKSNESIEWLDKHGATLSHVGQGGGSSAARMHGPADGAFVGPIFLSSSEMKLLSRI